MQVNFSRNPNSFALNRYLYIVPVDKTVGLYTQMTVEEAGRLLNSGEDLWPYGEDEPQDRGRVEKFQFPSYGTLRRRYGFRIPMETAEEASWDILSQHAKIVMQRAMTRRTERTMNKLQTSANWPAANTIAVASISGVAGKWDQSTTARMDIKKSLIYASQVIQKQTLGAVKPNELKLVMGPDTAAAIVVAQEIVDFIKGSTDAREYIGNKLGPNAYYGLPKDLYGFEVVVEDAVKVTTRKGASSQTKSFVCDGDLPMLLYRAAGKGGGTDDGLVGPENSNEAPTFSTVTGFVREDMTVESKTDTDNRVHKGRVVDNFAMELTAPISGFLFQDALT
jgi:hypothetical protein